MKNVPFVPEGQHHSQCLRWNCEAQGHLYKPPPARRYLTPPSSPCQPMPLCLMTFFLIYYICPIQCRVFVPSGPYAFSCATLSWHHFACLLLIIRLTICLLLSPSPQTSGQQRQTLLSPTAVMTMETLPAMSSAREPCPLTQGTALCS